MSDTSTRSGMLWEVERILTECKELETLPQILLMENVPQVHGTDNVKDFNKWQLRLQELGYSSYWEDLIATDYGIPQTRNRCFMVSILGDYSYTFPQPIPLKLKLKDMLENNVDEKYYLSDKIQEKILSVYNGNKKSVGIDLCDSQSKSRDICSTIKSRYDCGFEHFSPGPTGILENIKDTENYIEQTTQKEDIVINPLKGISGKSWQFEQQVYDENGSARTLKASEGSGNIPKVVNNMRIRKLTPRECFRLMGVKDEDFEKCAKNQSDSSLYHLAGDSIVCQGVLTSIFKELM